MRRRLAIALSNMKQLEYLWKNSKTETKLQVIRSCIFSTATYGCESWCLRKADLKRIDVFEMKCYRRALKISYTQHRRNDDIRRELKVKPQNLINIIKQRKLKYFGHIKRHETLEKHILEAKVNGKRRRGRPPRQWEQDIKEWLDTDVTTAGHQALNRNLYRRMVREATSNTDTPPD